MTLDTLYVEIASSRPLSLYEGRRYKSGFHVLKLFRKFHRRATIRIKLLQCTDCGLDARR